MSARKKAAKSSAKKQEESLPKNRNAALLTQLTQRLHLSPLSADRSALASSILEALLEEHTVALDSLLSQWSQDPQAIAHVTHHILESKLPLFVDRAIAILKADTSKQYVYPWLAQVLLSHPSKDLSQRFEGLQLGSEEGELEGLVRLQGKLGLILQE